VEIDATTEYTQIGIRSFGRAIFHRDPCHAEELSKLRYFQVNPERLIISNIMAWEGAVALSSEAERGCIGSNRFLSYKAVDEVDLGYLNYYFQSIAGREAIRSASTGTVSRNQTLSIHDFENLRVPAPKLAEQRRLATKLDTLTTKVEGIEFLRSHFSDLRGKLQESMVHRAQQSAVMRVHVGEALSSARTPIAIDPESFYRAIGMRSFGKGIIRYPSASGSDLSKLNYFRFPSGALALSNIKAWEGAIGVTTQEDLGYIASNRFLFYVPSSGNVDISYLRYYFLSKQGLAQISACSPGAADRNRTLGVKRFEAIQLTLPPIELQVKTAHVLHSLTNGLRTSHMSRTLSALRPALLSAAFGGRL
jgi:type I restriction enzyme S subunit